MSISSLFTNKKKDVSTCFCISLQMKNCKPIPILDVYVVQDENVTNPSLSFVYSVFWQF